MIAISDSSPIAFLSRIGHLHLLRDMFDAVMVPQAVYDEVALRGRRRPGTADLIAATWITVRPIANRSTLASLNL